MGTYMIGATVIESEDGGPVTLRSALDLLVMAYALHPALGEARLIALDAGVRPAFPDNVPRIVVRGRHIFVNGLYRHGFLLAPVLAELVADYLTGEAGSSPLIVEE
jgi:glycine oxidase